MGFALLSLPDSACQTCHSQLMDHHNQHIGSFLLTMVIEGGDCCGMSRCRYSLLISSEVVGTL